VKEKVLEENQVALLGHVKLEMLPWLRGHAKQVVGYGVWR
jgi:hypothetical protein